MPLTYFQDLFSGRPVLGTSVNPINSWGMDSPMAFAIGAHCLRYPGTTRLGVAVAFGGILALVLLEKCRLPLVWPIIKCLAWS
ncbi:hypothetical protein [Rhizobium leucaenae]|uniref:Uncharacterized protein n=1 Tax=Rhizobium leucaenae TaxID=29450 RepID=A0A7W7A012_9HYPH|nr:hypothetical protein [Rhizobium leucaenae]MBB4571766.1 hypothetical protein [Rhizobium leucaenae]MBB6305650.1 hypothetical protein [Rhizobium leucaenae]